MSDPYARVLRHPLGAQLARALGLPQPVVLRRDRRLPEDPVVLGSLGGPGLGAATLDLVGVHHEPALADAGGRPEEAGHTAYPHRVGGLVLDATAVCTVDDLQTVRALLRPALRALGPSGRVVLLGPVPGQSGQTEAAAAAQALDGITRSVGKELRAGGTANLVQVARGSTAAALASTLSFLLEGRSAYVSGQPVLVGEVEDVPELSDRPFQDRIVVVTGAARGIGAGIARTLGRDGAVLVLVDVPAAGQSLAAVANELGGTALQLDITTADAGPRIAAHVASRHGADARVHTIVHNAGITRDKLMVNTDRQRWGAVLDVNLRAALRITEVLLDPSLPGGLADGGRVVGVASTSGIAGNRGQGSYAASKAGVIGMVRALAPQVAARQITVNAVAPGFIETEMTGRIPFATRELARRFNSLQQGGLPVDVAETIGYLADPASAALSGQVLRVCGQSQIGA